MSDFFSGTEDRDVITGSFTSMFGNGGNDKLTDTAVFAIIYGDAGDDKLAHKATAGEAEIYGGSGDDIIDGAAGTDTLFGDSGADVIRGGEAFDQLFGGNGRDRLSGQGDGDILSGGLGNDILAGGSGGDSFVFDTKLDRDKNVDTIKDFSVNLSVGDSIFLDDAIFTEFVGQGASLTDDQFHKGKHAADAEDRIIYDPKSGDLFYDSNGSGKGHEVLFAQLDDHLGLGFNHFVIV